MRQPWGRREALAATPGQRYSIGMADEKAMQAIGRIEAALARIELVADMPREAPAHDDGELIALRQVHQALRGQVEGAIAQIDQLLTANERR